MGSLNQRLSQLLALLKIKENDRKTALTKLMDVRQQFDHLKSQLDKMNQYRLDYQRQINELGSEGCHINQVRNRMAFISQLEEGIKQLNHQLALIAKQRKQCEDLVLEKQQKVQSMEKLIENTRKNAEKALLKVEQKENDEYARNQWLNEK